MIPKLHQKRSSYLDEGLLFIDRFKVESVLGMWNSISSVLEKFQNSLLYVYSRKRVYKGGNNLWECNVQFLIWLFKLPCITLSLVITAITIAQYVFPAVHKFLGHFENIVLSSFENFLSTFPRLFQNFIMVSFPLTIFGKPFFQRTSFF